MSSKELAIGRNLANTSRGEGTFGLTKKDKLAAGRASAKALMEGTRKTNMSKEDKKPTDMTLQETIRANWEKGRKKAKSKSMKNFDLKAKSAASKGGYTVAEKQRLRKK